MPHIVLVLGAGPNVGLSLITHFSKNDFKTAVVSRNPSAELSTAADLTIKADFQDPKSIKGVFEEVKEKLGVPNVVVYNAYANTMTPDPISVPVDEFVGNLNVNLISPYAAMQEAVSGFRSLPSDVLKTFIYTGNALNNVTMPILLHLGVGKQGTAHMIESAVEGYGKEGFRFYFADERFEDGSSIFLDIGGQAHADFYLKLATQKEQGPWEATFVKGKGYVDFEGKVGELPKIEV